jgi:hypothetical protein
MFKFENLLASLVCVLIALATVYFYSWLLDRDPAGIVGWVALGIAAGATVRD